MEIVVGLLLLGVGLLALAELAILVRNPDGPRWLKLEMVVTSAILVVLTSLAMGLAFVIRGLATIGETGFSPSAMGLSAIILLVTVVGWRLLGVGRHLAAYEIKQPSYGRRRPPKGGGQAA